MADKTFGKKLKEKREEKRKSQEEVAYVVSVSQGTISNWENDKREPTYPQVIKLTMALGINTTDLYDINNIKIEMI